MPEGKAMVERPVRLAELLSSLSLAIDIGLGLPMETMLRTTLIAVRLAESAGCSHDDIVAAYYLGLLRFVGCTTTSHDDSVVFGGDELAVGDLMVADDNEMMSVVERVVGGNRPGGAHAVAGFFQAASSGTFSAHHRMHCEAAAIIATRVGLGDPVINGLADIYERWDGHGSVRQAEGEAISLPMRIVQLATLAAYLSRTHKPEAIVGVVVSRAGRQLDPTLARRFASDADALLNGLDSPTLPADVLAAEPGEILLDQAAAIDRGLSAIADFGDFKSPHMLGHSRRVADIAEAAGRASSMPASDLVLLRRAALVHDLGRVGVQAQILSKSGPLTSGERERVRLHTYLTERIFADSAALREVGALGALHHERLDGSGYHRGLGGPMLPATARLLAASNAWCALTEPRPHRPTLTPTEAASALAAEAKSGRLDGRAVDAVLTATGQRSAQARRAGAIPLSEREIEVLRLVARQSTNKQIAETLDISPKTVERHVTNIYNKIGVTTRAGAALYATDAGLL